MSLVIQEEGSFQHILRYVAASIGSNVDCLVSCVIWMSIPKNIAKKFFKPTEDKPIRWKHISGDMKSIYNQSMRADSGPGIPEVAILFISAAPTYV